MLTGDGEHISILRLLTYKRCSRRLIPSAGHVGVRRVQDTWAPSELGLKRLFGCKTSLLKYSLRSADIYRDVNVDLQDYLLLSGSREYSQHSSIKWNAYVLDDDKLAFTYWIRSFCVQFQWNFVIFFSVTKTSPKI